MHSSIEKRMRHLQSRGEPYAFVQVVRRKIPSSGKPGDKAVITKNGKITGWIGGGCTQGIAIKESVLAIEEGKPRFVRIGASSSSDDMPNTKFYQMTCLSGGSVDLYIEPIPTKPNIIIFGRSHIGMALARICQSLDYPTSVVADKIDANDFPNIDITFEFDQYDLEMANDKSYVVVCTQGNGDEIALDLALKGKYQYISLVSSRRKANGLFRQMKAMGYTFEELKKIKTPAGMDIHAKLPEEVAISILAEIIAHYRAPQLEQTEDLTAMQSDEYYINPVCNIPIQKSTAKHIIEYNGEKVYFCCDGCKVSFEKEPEKYIS